MAEPWWKKYADHVTVSAVDGAMDFLDWPPVFSPEERGPYGLLPTPDSLKESPPASPRQRRLSIGSDDDTPRLSEEESEEKMPNNPWRNESAQEARDRQNRLEAELRPLVQKKMMLDSVIKLKMEAQLPYSDLAMLWILFLHERNRTRGPVIWSNWVENLPKTKEEIIAANAVLERNRHLEMIDFKSKSLEAFEAERQATLDRIREIITELQYHLDVVNAKVNVPRGLGEEFVKVDWDWMNRSSFTAQKLEERLAEGRMALSRDSLEQGLRQYIDWYNRAVDEMAALEERYTRARETKQPKFDPAALDLTDPKQKEWYQEWVADKKRIDNELQDIRDSWFDLERRVRSQDKQMDALTALIRIFYDPQFKAESLGYARYGTTLGEDMPPWREAELKRMMDTYRSGLESAQNTLRWAKERLKTADQADVEELRRLYTGKGKMQKNASEVRLRAKHKEALAEDVELAKNSVTKNKMELEEREKKWNEFQEKKKALLAMK